MDLLNHFTDDPVLRDLAGRMTEGRRVVVGGVAGSSTSFLAGALARSARRPVVCVVAHLDEADESADEIGAMGVPAVALPAMDTMPGEGGLGAERLAERLAAVTLAERLPPDEPGVVFAPIQALMQTVPTPEQHTVLVRTVQPGQRLDPGALVEWLADAGYARVDVVEEPGHVAVRGGIVDVYPAGGRPVRLDFFGDELDRLSEIDLDSMGTDRSLDRAEFIAVRDGVVDPDHGVCALERMPTNALALLAETMEVVEQGRGYYERVTDARGLLGPPAVLKVLENRFPALAEVNQFSAGGIGSDDRLDLPVSALPGFARDASDAVRELGELAHEVGSAVLCCQNEGEQSRASELLTEHAAGAPVRTPHRYVHRGFVWEGENPIAIVPHHELFHRFGVRRRRSRLRAGRAMDTFLDFGVGDHVVHADHGIARFAGLKTIAPKARGGSRAATAREAGEYLTLEFSKGAKLHVPALQVDRVQRYVGGFSGRPTLSVLGGKRWQSQKDKVTESVRDLAAEMLRVRAAREAIPGVRCPADTAWQAEFEAEFPYDETEDQLAALGEIKKDMQSERPMDRLLCGDVGFGKTELAIRAAFKVCEMGRQVAVLVPTTVLCEQHERTFRERFAEYPFRIASLSRFKTGQEINATLKAVRQGHVDVVIGTHRLLSKDVRFADLGLVVVDEEQRFGVEHKEALLKLRLTVDVLTLSATPIPRTLHLSMLGLRDISSLATPPVDRRGVVTEVIPYNPKRIKQAIDRELAREGQVFYVHNRVRGIEMVADEIQKLAPGARIVTGHGQMPPRELEEVMLKFTRREADILVSTTIIESGLDIPTANTMIINDADRFGLAELHQLRGRVGRYKHRAYCYLLLPLERTVNEVAKKRLKAIEEYSMLGAGFKIAMRDLEIRGAGNLLGSEQSGHIAAVGYEMYCQLLERATAELKNEAPPSWAGQTTLELGIGGAIPRAYIPSDMRRLDAYRRLATASSDAEIEKLREDLTGAYGSAPAAVEQLLDLAAIRVGAASLGVRAIVRREHDLVFRAADTNPIADRLRESTLGVTTVLPPKSNESVGEVYLRLPERCFEQDTTLLAVLRKRLVSAKPSHPAQA